ncbi:hypothetical protein [Roseimaritima multifibrata]|uniref:hypothetical protein n=1 Tax=Roseimaritima multifibrata TaxID=1930274 RepID=UPI001C54CDE5|nr:hypothetical protein [Roseimaritima multifibrata]
MKTRLIDRALLAGNIDRLHVCNNVADRPCFGRPTGGYQPANGSQKISSDR